MGVVIKTSRSNFVRSDPVGGLIRTQTQILDLLVLCREAGSNKVLISGGSLHPDFFDLSSGMAGDITLKLSTYRVQTAIIADLAKITSERFQEWTFECNRGSELRFFAEQPAAEDWLLGK